MKFITVGLDGASFELLEPWIEDGDLPNLKKLREKGVWGDMESCLPPVSSPNWKCYSTGKNPGKLGIFWWENVDFENREVYCPDYRSKSEEIWDYLNRKNTRAAVINMPMAYPPKQIDGYMVAGGPSAKEENSTYPTDWKEELESKEYKIHPEKSISSRDVCHGSYDEIVDMIEGRFELAREIIEEGKIGFMHLTIFYINVLQHYLWGEDRLKEGWKIIDEKLGELMGAIEENGWNLIIFSDHGSNRIKDVFNINAWLEKNGYLKTKRLLSSKVLNKLRLNRASILRLSEKLGIKGMLRSVLSEKVVDRVPSKTGGVSGEAKADMIDWNESRAIALGQGPLYLSAEKVREEIIQGLENLESPFTNRKIIRRVFSKEEIYSGGHLDEAPDLIVDQSPHVHISGELGKEQIFENPGKWKGENKKEGLFLAYGPDVREGEEIEDIKILDIAPTILHSFNHPIPREMDGKVLKKIFVEGTDPSEREVEFLEIGEREKAKVRKKVKSLKKAGEV